MTDSANYKLKIILIGDISVGKTSIIKRLIDKQFSGNQCSTIAIDCQMYSVQIDGIKFTLNIWDPSGSERFQSVTRSFYRGADCALLVYDVTNRDSFDKLNYWLKMLNQNCEREDCMKILIGNKKDLIGSNRRPAVDESEIREWLSRHQILISEVSAKDSDGGVREAFETLIKVTTVYQNALADKRSKRRQNVNSLYINQSRESSNVRKLHESEPTGQSLNSGSNSCCKN